VKLTKISLESLIFEQKNRVKHIVVWLGIFFIIFQATAQSGSQFQITITNCPTNKLYLAEYYGHGMNFIDSAKAYSAGKFKLTLTKPLQEGIYSLVYPDTSLTIDFIAVPNQQQLDFSFDNNTVNSDGYFIKGSSENDLYLAYIQYLANSMNESKDIENLIMKTQEGSAEENLFLNQLDSVEWRLKDYQQKIVQNNPKSMLSLLIEAGWEPQILFNDTSSANRRSAFLQYRKEYLSHFDLSDKRHLRTNILASKLDNYLDKMHPIDSAFYTIQDIVSRFGNNNEAKNYFIKYWLTKYYYSDIVKADAVFVQLCNQYIDSIDIEGDIRTKYKSEAQSLEQVLIGKPAPILRGLMDKNNQVFDMEKIGSDYTILYFFQPDCSSCKKSIAPLNRILSQYNRQTIQLVAICKRKREDVPACWEYEKTSELKDWTILADPYSRSRYEGLYRVLRTPMLYLLDKNKNIVIKEISAEQLEEMLPQILSK